MIIAFPRLISLGWTSGEDVGIYKDNGAMQIFDFRLTILDLVTEGRVRAVNAFHAKSVKE
jgi:hypothetical protein